jgi:cytochrome b561
MCRSGRPGRPDGIRLRNGEHGYGVVTKALHWFTVAAIVAQFAVGWTKGADGTRLERIENEIDRLEDGLDAREDSYFADAFTQDGLSQPEVRVLLGLSIILLGLIRVLWQAATPLPPWADHLSAGERRLEARLPLHITAQLVLLAAIAVHVGLVRKHTVVQRDHHLARML